jgi:hypothetical protein
VIFFKGKKGNTTVQYIWYRNLYCDAIWGFLTGFCCTYTDTCTVFSDTYNINGERHGILLKIWKRILVIFLDLFLVYLDWFIMNIKGTRTLWTVFCVHYLYYADPGINLKADPCS